MKTEKRRRFIINLTYWLLVLALVYVLVKYLLPLVTPFVIAFVIAFMLRSPIRFLVNKCRMGPKLASALSVTLFFLTVGALIGFAGAEIFMFLKNLFLGLPSAYTNSIAPALLKLNDWIRETVGQLDPEIIAAIDTALNNIVRSLGNIITSFSFSVVGGITVAATGLPVLLITVLMTIISTFFLSADYERVTGFLLAQLSEKNRELVHQIRIYIVEILFKYIKSYSLIMLITFGELSIGLSVLGVKNAILIALLIAIFDILPVLGTGGIMIPWLIISFINGDIRMGVGLLILYIVITVIRNVIEPKIIGQHVGLHPIVTLIAMFVGTALFGVVGLFGLPISLAIINSLNETGAIHLFRKPGGSSAEEGKEKVQKQ